jgi:hypothetical protein
LPKKEKGTKTNAWRLVEDDEEDENEIQGLLAKQMSLFGLFSY